MTTPPADSVPDEIPDWRLDLIAAVWAAMDATGGDGGSVGDEVDQAISAWSHDEDDVVVPESGWVGLVESQCANPKCGIWFHVGGDNRCPECGTLPDGAHGAQSAT